MDFECTCEAELYDYEHEIIEFPAILVDVHRREIEMVDKAMPFIDVLDSFRAWMQSHHLGQKGVHYAFITDGSVHFLIPEVVSFDQK
ncbi:unnamed protein product [Gongylonema pulchrum]|uniref:Exonuclease domain-containing protein n=1 Tax=Gongylonema pulchrum TaxID=637853 RepID=A0A183D373_9BILA|nr:unnamed protein product [Gongylonema pulchrum]